MKDSATKEYIKLKTEDLLDLEALCAEYGMTAEELVDFHNRHCSISELLSASLPKYVEYIYIPSDKFKARDNRLLKSTVLEIPAGSSDKVYGVIIRFLPKNLQIHYKTNIRRTPACIELSKEKTYVNNQGIDKIIEQLFEKAEQVLYPLQIDAGSNGSMQRILNKEDISQRWKTECFPKLKEYYQSETTDRILEQLDQAYADIDLKKDLFNRNIFYKLFFLPVYKGYPKFFSKDFLQIYFSGLSRDARYEIEYSLNKEYTRGNKIVLRITGTEEEDAFNRNKPKGKVDLLYKFERETREIFSISGTLSTFDKGKEYEIDFQVYEQIKNQSVLKHQKNTK
ncbi:hypothetical protein [Chryseobacterium luteum]|uniref:Uncharacterized protein n=1 Tax=Chryseobacterium luteum TaxID=421531 RepID=A0A085ZF85_9FLAO|nr:hypothetical protein [Chryseobacterium luteum]KFF03099.1 hypothetical protein IX38_12055 [Chryseobacterium luteum]